MELEFGISLAFVVLGVLLLIAELSSPGAFLLVPGTVLIIMGFVGMVAPDVLFSVYSPIIVVVIIVPLTLVTIKLYQRLAPPGPPETTVASSLVGLEGVVTHDVRPGMLSGKVKIRNDSWSATSDHEISKGTKVVVLKSEGVHVTVGEKK
ncbi:MAG: NfeD family protein [Methanomassiliicoccales archaeon]|jgi:membrane protein implicated in regulation of membrane protease activity